MSEEKSEKPKREKKKRTEIKGFMTFLIHCGEGIRDFFIDIFKDFLEDYIKHALTTFLVALTLSAGLTLKGCDDEAKASANRGKVQALTQMVQELKDEVKNTQTLSLSAISNLDDKVADLSSSLNTTQGNVKTLDKSVSDVKGSVIDLGSKVDATKDQIAKIPAPIVNVTTPEPKNLVQIEAQAKKTDDTLFWGLIGQGAFDVLQFSWSLTRK